MDHGPNCLGRVVGNGGDCWTQASAWSIVLTLCVFVPWKTNVCDTQYDFGHNIIEYSGYKHLLIR